MARAAATALAGAATLLIGWFAVLQPFLQGPREDVLSTPGLSGLNVRQEVPVPAGRTACTAGVTVPKGTASVRYRIAGPLGSPPRLTLTVDGPGLAAKGSGAAVMPAGPDTFLTIPISPQAGTTALASLCLRPLDADLRLVGTDEGRSTVLATTSVAGKPQPSDISLTLLGERSMTSAASLRQAPDRIQATTGVPAAVTWVIAILAVALASLGSLAALVAAVTRSSRI